ncbi:hypothetical protein SH1V18_44030 [Vallitalea longa]|uniref:Stage III sporulation protein AF n=1 Tax=Vallitalea longa TaxID=2936439 RepID=A0A9W6DHX7_9FIRM|nr:stage III sporulation protein AF [Vallitalea longa]GKX31923.1 hypothetical protein SH1V18_44030 [Vallitalea longa]
MKSFYDFIRNIVLFLLLAKILEYLIPNGNMKKYFKLFSGIILIIIILTPIIKYNGILERLNLNIIENEFKINYSNSQDINNDYSDVHNEITMKIYKEKIITHIKDLLNEDNIHAIKASVVVEEDINTEGYGEIKEIYLTISNDTTDKESNLERVKIEKVLIGESGKEQDLRTSQDILLEKKIKNIIKNFYKLSSNNIHITIETC